MGRRVVVLVLLAGLILGGCAAPAAPVAGAAGPAGSPSAPTPPTAGQPRVLATTTFLADIAQNVAGDRLKVAALLPEGVDQHSYEPAPGDVMKVAQSTVLIENGAGYEAFLDKLMQNAGAKQQIIVTSAGLAGRTAREGEAAEQRTAQAREPAADPHLWLDPTKVVKYVENIRAGLSQADPAGASTYAANASAYIKQLQDLDALIGAQVQAIPPDQRLLVTNHESLGYFADRYGFRVIGTVIPSVSTEASPSAQELARLVDQIKSTHARAIFLETGTNAQLAQQVATDTGARVVTDLYTESTTGPNGPAPTYMAMMKHDTQAIVDALK